MILRGNFYSDTLEMTTSVVLMTPESRPERAIYLLHGLSGSHTSWTDFSMLPLYGENTNTLFVMPEVGRSFYSDMRMGGKFLSYVADELPRLCERVFGIVIPRERRIVAGVSMGGYGALKVALSRPERFGACCAFSSPCLFIREDLDEKRDYFDEVYGARLGADFRAILGPNLELDAEMDVFELARRSADSEEKPLIYATCGKNDDMRSDNELAMDELKALGYDVTYEEWEGGHDWTFFDESLKKALAWMN